jgi:hypothetical protein
VLGAIVHDGLVITAPSQDWVEKDFRPIAAASTNRTNTTTINHLLILTPPGRIADRAESISD